jgi:uncharacterized protein YdiU (UPF0061 family)
VVKSFPQRFHASWTAGMRAKLGLGDGSSELVDDLLALLEEQRVDFTSFFRALSDAVRGDATAARLLFTDFTVFDAWAERWRAELPPDREAVADAMDRVNPVYIPRNHLVEEALAAATAGDLGPFERLIDALAKPFDERPGLEQYAAPAPPSFGAGFRTYCGT